MRVHVCKQGCDKKDFVRAIEDVFSVYMASSKCERSWENFQKSFKPLAVSWFCFSHFHTTRWKNSLDGQIVSDDQIVWCENRAN